MSTYIYVGPPSGVTLADGREVMLWPNAVVDLPECDYTSALIDRGHLRPAPPAPLPKGAAEQTGTKNKE